MLIHLLSKGGSQFTLTSQWESRNVKTSPLASEAPSSLVRMSPSRFLVRTILTLAKRTMYSSSFSFKCSRKKGKKSVSGARPGGANRRTGWHATCKSSLSTSISYHLESSKICHKSSLRQFGKCKCSLFYHTEEDTGTLDLLLQLLLATCHPRYNHGQNNCRIFIHPLVPAAQGQINILACCFINSVLSKWVSNINWLWRTMQGMKFLKIKC